MQQRTLLLVCLAAVSLGAGNSSAQTVSPTAVTAAGPNHIALANDWMPRKGMVAQKMMRSLAFFSLAAVDGASPGSEAIPDKILWDLKWLMPVAAAEKLLPGVQRVQREYRLQNPCFPQSSIYVKEYIGTFIDPNSKETFREASLICDAQRRLISIQLNHNHPKVAVVGWELGQSQWWTPEPWMVIPEDINVKSLPGMTGNLKTPGPDGRREPYYDFISLKANASTSQEVWYQVRKTSPGVTCIHTMLIKGVMLPIFYGEVIENIRWYHTAPFARKILDIAKVHVSASTPVR